MEIRVENLSKSFKNIQVLKNLNLTFKEGKIYGLYGRNGSGKSVFIKCLCGFLKPSKGRILYNNVDIADTIDLPLNVGVLIERPTFFPNLTGFENLLMLAKIKNIIGVPEITEALDTVNLTSDKDKKYSKYSLGMKQKLGIAQAIMENQDVIILDEPFNGIEKDTVEKLITYLVEEKKKGKIIIVSTHILADLEKMADTIYYFDDGEVSQAR